MNLILRKLEVDGEHTSDEIDEKPVRLLYSDAPERDGAQEWLEVRLKSPAGYSYALPEVELYALELLRKSVGERIRVLTHLKDRG